MIIIQEKVRMQIFTHIAPGGVVRHWAVEPLWAYVTNEITTKEPGTNPHIRVLNARIDPEYASMIPVIHAIDVDYAMSLPVEKLKRPLLGVDIDMGPEKGGRQPLVIDGHHRMYRNWRDGRESMFYIVVAEPLWTDFLVPMTEEEAAPFVKDVRETTPGHGYDKACPPPVIHL